MIPSRWNLMKPTVILNWARIVKGFKCTYKMFTAYNICATWYGEFVRMVGSESLSVRLSTWAFLVFNLHLAIFEIF